MTADRIRQIVSRLLLQPVGQPAAEMVFMPMHNDARFGVLRA